MIQVNNLSFHYGQETQVLHHLNFDIQSGEIFGFLGPSGAGKTTTQQILMGLLNGFEGQVKVMGRDIQNWGKDYYEKVGVSFELPNHYNKLTALENLHYFRQLYSGPTTEPLILLAQVGLAEHGHQRVAEFSKGMKNRLTLARSLINQPDLLFLDEPTSGLDPANAQRVIDLIKEKQRQGTTIFLTTHAMSVADQLCDRVAFLVGGHIKLIDNPRELKLQHGQRSVQVEFENGQMEEFNLDGLAENQAFLSVLRRSDLQTIHSKESTLEQIFLDITGQELI